MQERFGRIQLDRVVAEWEAAHPINPRLLASEVAETLRTLAPPSQLIQEIHASALLSTPTPRGNTITYGALAAYFDRTSQGKPSDTIITSAGPVPAAAVLIWRQWINTITGEATERALRVVGFALPANDSTSAVMVASGAPETCYAPPPSPPSGSAPGYLKMRQANQRREGESSAAERLEAEQIKRQRLERDVIELRARLVTKEAQAAQLLEEGELQRREISEEKRARREAEDAQIAMEELLEDAMAFAECLRPDNPISPPEMRMAFKCWRDLTRGGTHDPAARGGRGCHPLVADWISSTQTNLNADQEARLKAMVSWRKRGAGAIPT